MPKVVVGGKVSPDIYGAKTGPRGPQGVKGDKGDTGDTGPAGAGITAWVEEFDNNDVLSSVEAQTDVVLNDHRLYYRQDNDKNHSLGWGYQTHGVDGPILNGFTGVGIAIGDANNSTDTLVAEFSSSRITLKPLSTGGPDKLVTTDFQGRLSTIDKPQDIEYYFSNSTNWAINHNLGKKPQMSVYSVGGKEMWAEIIHTTLNLSNVYFDEPTSGYAVISQ